MKGNTKSINTQLYLIERNLSTHKRAESKSSCFSQAWDNSQLIGKSLVEYLKLNPTDKRSVARAKESISNSCPYHINMCP